MVKDKDKDKETGVLTKNEEKMIVVSMLEVWKKHKPNYFDNKEIDFPALLNIGYQIAKIKDWRKCQIVGIKESECLKYWETVVKFISTNAYFGKLTLDSISTDKMWQKIIQEMKQTDGKYSTSNTKIMQM